MIPLSGVGAANPDLIGGKARGFAVIARAGLPAPEGFVLTTAVHRAAVADSGRIPDPVARHVVSLVRALGDAPLAVRSSATAEDGAEHSHAGQYLTRLGVRGPEETLDAILECWASAEDPRATAYRAHRGHDGGVDMAVIVQRLAGGEAAGVCMSRDPVTGDPDTIVVNAAYGLGELVVSGLVTPDDYRLARADGRLAAVRAGLQGHHARDGPRRPCRGAGARGATRSACARRRLARRACSTACCAASANSASPPTASSASSTGASCGCSAAR